MKLSEDALEIYLIRHAESEGNATGILQGRSEHDLTPRGREQARLLGEALSRQGMQPSAIYSSDQSRARQTAEILASALDVPAVRERPDLREIDLGPVTGLTRDEADRRYPQAMSRFDQGVSLGESLPGAESWGDVQRRAGRAFRAIRGKHDAGEVLIVSHGALLVNMLKAILKVPARRKLIVPIPNASVTRLVFDGDLVWLAELCRTTHLK